MLVYTFTATPIYKARVQLLIEAEKSNVVSFKEVIEQDKATNDYYQTQYRILQSRSLARRTLDRMNAWDVFDSTKAPKKTSIKHGGGGRHHFRGPPRRAETARLRRRTPDETAAQSRILNDFLANLTVTPIRNSRLVEIEFASPHRNVAATGRERVWRRRTSNRISSSSSRRRRTRPTGSASAWANSGQAVTASESALQKYREQTDAVSLEERQNIVVQKLADLNAAVTKAKTERIQKEAAYNQIKAVQNDRAALDTIPAILSNQFIQQQKTELAELQRQEAQLSEKLGQRHPDMVKAKLAVQNAEARIQAEIAKVVHVAVERLPGGALAGAEPDARARAAEARRAGAESQGHRIRRPAARCGEQPADLRIAAAAHQGNRHFGRAQGEQHPHRRRGGSAAEAGQPEQAAERSCSPFWADASPAWASPSSSSTATTASSRRRRIKSHLGLPFIGMIPKMTVAAGESSPLLDKGATPNFAEALRTVRTNVLFSSTAEGGQSIVVTSSGPGEGKTVVSSNLALALAQTGQRVLLIDADMRRPRVHQVFAERQEPGLSNVLVGDTKTADAVRPTSCSTLWVLPAGHLPPNPAELLGSKRFEEFIETLKQHFAFVVIDSPPIMAVSDSAIVAHMADGVLFVIGSEMTSRTVARTAVEQLVNANGRMIGAVLNRVDLTHNAYYYSQYYRREYGHYYIKGATAKSA